MLGSSKAIEATDNPGYGPAWWGYPGSVKRAIMRTAGAKNYPFTAMNGAHPFGVHVKSMTYGKRQPSVRQVAGATSE